MQSLGVRTLGVAGLAALAMVGGVATPVGARSPDAVGWSVAVDPRGRAFLTFVGTPGGPRLLVIGCLRDADMLNVQSTGVAATPTPRATLELAGGAAHYRTNGEVEPGRDGEGPTFLWEDDADAATRRAFAAAILPVLKGADPLTLTVAGRSVTVPAAGLAPPLRRFEAICFGR